MKSHLSVVDLEALAMALADQGGYEHHWLIDSESGQISLWTEEGGIDGQHPVDLDEVDLIGIHPLPPYVWYQGMADFADGSAWWSLCVPDMCPGRQRTMVGRALPRYLRGRLRNSPIDQYITSASGSCHQQTLAGEDVMLISTLPEVPGYSFEVKGIVVADATFHASKGGKALNLVQALSDQAQRLGGDAVVDVKTILGGDSPYCVMTGTAVRLSISSA